MNSVEVDDNFDVLFATRKTRHELWPLGQRSQPKQVAEAKMVSTD
jgi:hypothetical protein